mmetsp:Transcript_803/g.1733  ORF Transcript_803/g.1733 Transcript_803/m.1733 type:complete len:253 (+) Transcript_803:404-1162(+)
MACRQDAQEVVVLRGCHLRRRTGAGNSVGEVLPRAPVPASPDRHRCGRGPTSHLFYVGRYVRQRKAQRRLCHRLPLPRLRHQHRAVRQRSRGPPVGLESSLRARCPPVHRLHLLRSPLHGRASTRKLRGCAEDAGVNAETVCLHREDQHGKGLWPICYPDQPAGLPARNHRMPALGCHSHLLERLSLSGEALHYPEQHGHLDFLQRRRHVRLLGWGPCWTSRLQPQRVLRWGSYVVYHWSRHLPPPLPPQPP